MARREKRQNTVESSRDGAKPSKSGRDRLSNILIGVGILLLLVAGGIYAYNMLNYKKIDDINERVAEYAKLTDDDEQPPQIDWAALKAMNPDIVGWLEVPHTVVNYPVYQAGDNDYYLHHAPDGGSSIGGSVFMDYENESPGMLDAQTIVYGHHMRNGSQFKYIADMDKQEMFDGVNLIWYCTEQKNYDLAPLFLYYTNEDDTDVRQFTFESPQKFHEYLSEYYGNAVTMRADAEAVIAQVEHVFTLSTCNYYDGSGRTLLVCVLRSEIPGTPQYEAAEPARAQKKAEQAAAAQKATPSEGDGTAQEQQPEGSNEEAPSED